MKKFIIYILIYFICTGCFTIIRPGEVGLKRTFGKLHDRVLLPGLHPYNFFVTKIIKVPVRTTNMQVDAESLPSKEGLNVRAEFAILYHLKKDYAKPIVETIGLNYENAVILSVLRSAAPNITSKYFAKDMYTLERAQIGREIAEEMTRIIGDRGIVIEAVLLKTIKLPQGLASSIEQKLEAEQDAQRMEFVLARERKEADRKVIEAEGIKKSQLIIAEGLTPAIIQFKSISAFLQLAESPNTKLIVTDGKTPFLINANSGNEVNSNQKTNNQNNGNSNNNNYDNNNNRK